MQSNMNRSKSKSMENLLCEESADDLFKSPTPVSTPRDYSSESSANDFDFEQYYYALTSESERSLDTFQFKVPATPPRKPKRSDLNAPIPMIKENTNPVDKSTQTDDSDSDPGEIVEEGEEEVSPPFDTPPQLEWDNEDLHLFEQFDIFYNPDPWWLVKRCIKYIFYWIFVWLIHKLGGRLFDWKY